LAVALAVRDWRIVPALAVKVAEEAPAATVTDAGTLSSFVLEVTPTVVPPAGAAALSVMEQELVPPE
jgi:hypothetical protein